MPPIPRWLFTALGEPKTIALFSVSMVEIISLTVGSNGRWRPSTTLVWAAPDGGAGRMFSIDDMIWDSQRRPVSAAVGRMLGQGRVTSRPVRTRGDGFGDDLKAALLERHFWARNAPYTLTDPSNPLKSQQMRPPSERTKAITH
jgi:hypothetical protein